MDNPVFEPDDLPDDIPDDNDITPPRDYYSQTGGETEPTDCATTNQPGTSTP